MYKIIVFLIIFTASFIKYVNAQPTFKPVSQYRAPSIDYSKLYQRKEDGVSFFKKVLSIIKNPIPEKDDVALERTDNFLYSGPTSVSQDMLQIAENIREDFSETYFGTSLPPSIGPVILYFEPSDTEDSNLTWTIDDPQRKFHTIWLKCSPQRIHGACAHEMTHALLATRYPNQITPLFTEAIATLHDDPKRIKIYNDLLQYWSRSKNFPPWERLFQPQNIPNKDKAGYGAAHILARYLLNHTPIDKPQLNDAGDPATPEQILVMFAANSYHPGQKNTNELPIFNAVKFNEALQKYYDIKDIQELVTRLNNYIRERGAYQNPKN